jgi:2-hydroxy-3-oxopropionate reductase
MVQVDRPAREPRVGFVGLGAMGRPMATHLVGAGFAVTVHSRSPGPVEALVALGASRASTPAEVSSRSDVILTSLPGLDEVEAVVTGPDGLLSSLAAGSVIVDMSTLPPLGARRVALAVQQARGSFLDAPVSGGVRGAQEATLSIMVGGSAAALERARPVLDALGSTIVHCGESGAGQIAKACNQLVVLSTIHTVAQALVLAAAAGVDPARIREALLGGFANSRVLDVHGQRMLDRNFQPGGTVRQNLRDARIVLASADELGVSLHSFEPVADALQALVDDGQEGLDHSALFLVVERAAGRTPG